MLALQTVLLPDPHMTLVVGLVPLPVRVLVRFVRVVDVDVPVDLLGVVRGLVVRLQGLFGEVFEVLDGGVQVADEGLAAEREEQRLGRTGWKGRRKADREREKSSRTTTRKSLSVPACGAIV